MSFYNQYGYNQIGYSPYGQMGQMGQMGCLGQEWMPVQIMGLIRPYYVHVPTLAVYEFPAITGSPVGMYNMTTGYVTVTNQAINQSLFGMSGYGNLSYGSMYRSLPVQGPYSASALAMQGGKYPVTTMSVPNQYAYSSLYGLGNY